MAESMSDANPLRNERIACWAAIALALAAASFPAAEAAHGGWWIAQDTPTTHPDYPNPGSQAKIAGMKVFDVKATWLGSGGGAGIFDIRYYEPNTHQEVSGGQVLAVEDITSVMWIECPFANSDGANFEVVPAYSVVGSGLHIVGVMRTSFCNDSTVPDAGDPVANDPLFYKAFSDFRGWHVTQIEGAPVLFELELYVRGLDHA